MNNLTKISIPYNNKLIVWRNNYLNNNVNFFIYSDNKYLKFSFSIDNKLFFIDKWSNTIYVDKSKLNFKNNKLNKFINSLLKSWDIYFFNKIKFKGKGFRIKFFKKIKLIKFYFGRSHKTFMLLKKIKRKRINKYKFLLIGLKKQNVIKNRVNIIKIKPINIYTLRGLRNSNQIIFKRKGKKGTYI